MGGVVLQGEEKAEDAAGVVELDREREFITGGPAEAVGEHHGDGLGDFERAFVGGDREGAVVEFGGGEAELADVSIEGIVFGAEVEDGEAAAAVGGGGAEGGEGALAGLRVKGGVAPGAEEAAGACAEAFDLAGMAEDKVVAKQAADGVDINREIKFFARADGNGVGKLKDADSAGGVHETDHSQTEKRYQVLHCSILPRTAPGNLTATTPDCTRYAL